MTSKYVCIKRCFWGDKLWEKGEEIVIKLDNKDFPPPHHFALVEEAEKEVKSETT
jgi:hypothetical protein